jgi:UDP-glucose 4-epimerase
VASLRYSGVISIFANRIRNCDRVQIFGDGNQVRDVVHVGDAVPYLLAAIIGLRSKARSFAICTGQRTSVSEWAGMVAEACQFPVGVEFRPARSGDIRISIGDPDVAAEYCGFVATTPTKEGLQQMPNGSRGCRNRARASPGAPLRRRRWPILVNV